MSGKLIFNDNDLFYGSGFEWVLLFLIFYPERLFKSLIDVLECSDIQMPRFRYAMYMYVLNIRQTQQKWMSTVQINLKRGFEKNIKLIQIKKVNVMALNHEN